MPSEYAEMSGPRRAGRFVTASMTTTARRCQSARSSAELRTAAETLCRRAVNPRTSGRIGRSCVTVVPGRLLSCMVTGLEAKRRMGMLPWQMPSST